MNTMHVSMKVSKKKLASNDCDDDESFVKKKLKAVTVKATERVSEWMRISLLSIQCLAFHFMHEKKRNTHTHTKFFYDDSCFSWAGHVQDDLYIVCVCVCM